MLLSWHQLSSCLILLWLCSINALCPAYCTCKQTEKGKRKVHCVRGGMVDPIPVADMDSGMEILEISAPENKWNSLTTITPIFQRFKNVEEIHIKKSNIYQIAMHAFWGVPSINLLDLRLNNISAVYDHNFRGLVNLVELNLDDNRIKRLQNGVFKHLTELRILTLQRNLLEELVPRMFTKLGKLHVLKLSGNKLQELDPEVFKDISVSFLINIVIDFKFLS